MMNDYTNKLKEVELTFENCDSIIIPSENIGNMIINNIKVEISKIQNILMYINLCDTFAIEINKKANILHKPFSIEDDKYSKFIFDLLVDDRNITQIKLSFYNTDNDMKEFLLFVNWKDYDKANFIKRLFGIHKYITGINANQKSYIDKKGNLYLAISEKNNVKNIFGNNKNNMVYKYYDYYE